MSFTDKNSTDFNPYSYFDSHAIAKRQQHGLPLVMYSDLPVNPGYVDKVNRITRVYAESRWLNAVTVSPDKRQLADIQALPFVQSVTPLNSYAVINGKDRSTDYNRSTVELLKEQTGSMGGDLFKAAGIDGHGVRIAVFDAGFPGVDTLREFKRLREEGRIIDTWDFVKKRKDVYNYNAHGTGVLGCIAGVIDSLTSGLGTGAEFLLARTEVQAEVFSEEENWSAAMEWADRHGVDIISSSLGYTFNRYFPKQMDGKSTFISRMANMAAAKGILVINAAGNDGDDDWEVIGAPADADSVLTIGGIDSETGIHMDFSSFGPTYDGRLKPNVSAFADVITTDRHGQLRKEYGTSFAAPLVTGFAACVMQMHPDWNNMKVFSEIEKSGHLYPYYDYAHGYGVPQATYFLGPHEKHSPTFTIKREFSFLTVIPEPTNDVRKDKNDPGKRGAVEISIGNDNKTIIINNDTVIVVKHHTDRIFNAISNEESYTLDNNYLYFHFADRQSGLIRYYAVVNMEDAKQYRIDLDEMKDNEKLMIHYRGYTTSYLKKDYPQSEWSGR